MSERYAPLAVLAAGGTGGHVYPAEALSAELMKRGYRLALITDRRGDAYGGVLGELETYRVRAGGIAGRGLLARAKSAFDILFGIWQARSLLNRLRPDAVVGFGGYASVPTMLAACMGKYNTAIHEQNAIFGRANRLLASRVKRVVTCFERMENIPEGIEGKIVWSGMPVRSSVIEQRQTPYPAFEDGAPIELLVLGGSQGARVFSDVVPAAIAALPAEIKTRLRLTQQCRSEDMERVRAFYDECGVAAELSPFFDDAPRRMAKSHLIISRSGASSISECLVIGRPSVLVPYPHAVDDHQVKNAHAADDAGAGWLIPEASFTSEVLTERLTSLFTQPATLISAAACARAAGQPDAVERLAEIIEDLMGVNGSNGSNDNGSNKGRQAA